MKPKDTLLLEQAYRSIYIKENLEQILPTLNFQQTTKKNLKYQPFKGTQEQMPALSYMVVKEPQEVVTITADGKETQNKAEPNDIIISGPSKEKYAIKAAKFPKLYQGKIGDVVIPEQSPRMVAQVTNLQQPITFKAPWKEDMILKPGDYLVKDGDQGYYRIAKKEYEQTYNPLKSFNTNENLQNSIDEGIWDRVKGLGSGIKAGASILGQNLKDKAVTALGGTPQQRSGETAGQAYAKAQQGSLKNSFIKKATKEIEDFKNDLKVMGIKQTDAELRAAGLNEIADKIKDIEDLVKFLQTQKSSSSTQSLPTNSQSNTTTNTQTNSNTQTSSSTRQQSAPNTPTSPVTPTNNASQQTPSSPSQRQRNAKGQFTSSKQAQPQQNNTQP